MNEYRVEALRAAAVSVQGQPDVEWEAVVDGARIFEAYLRGPVQDGPTSSPAPPDPGVPQGAWMFRP